MITYDHMIPVEDLISDLWEHELHFIAHADILKLAEACFKDRLMALTKEQVLDHHQKVIGGSDNAL